MAARLSSGAAIEIFETLDSTNAEAKRRAQAGARGPLWLIALEQTVGYGRRGSAWTQRAGDVAATLLFDPEAENEQLPQLSFVVGVAIAETLHRFSPEGSFTLKWPNDVLLEGRKIAGLLLELVNAPSGRNGPLVAFGAGVNVVSKPADTDYPTARLLDAPALRLTPAPVDFVRVLDEILTLWLERWKSDGFAPVRTAWLERAASLGEKIRVRLPNEIVEGVFRDLDKGGALVLECENGPRLIAAGAVLPPERTG